MVQKVEPGHCCAYARQDAAAAFRLAEVSNLDLIKDFPQIVTQHCDQPPFLALILEKVSHESERIGLLARLINEAALRSAAVAKVLFYAEPSAILRNYTLKVAPRRRWYRKSLLPERLYTQLLTVALSAHVNSKENYPLSQVLNNVQQPGGKWVVHVSIPLIGMVAGLVVMVIWVTSSVPTLGGTLHQ